MTQRTTAWTFRAARIAAGLSVAELAEAAGVYPQTIRKIEAGRSKPQMATARAVSTATGVSVPDLLLVDQEVSA